LCLGVWFIVVKFYFKKN